MNRRARRNRGARKLIPLAAVGLFLPAEVASQNGTLSGQVTAATSGRPINGAQVRIEDTQLRERTDADGRFLISDVAPGSYTVHVYHVDYGAASVYGPAREQVTVSPGGAVTVDFALDVSPLPPPPPREAMPIVRINFTMIDSRDRAAIHMKVDSLQHMVLCLREDTVFQRELRDLGVDVEAELAGTLAGLHRWERRMNEPARIDSILPLLRARLAQLYASDSSDSLSMTVGDSVVAQWTAVDLQKYIEELESYRADLADPTPPPTRTQREGCCLRQPCDPRM